MDEEKVNLTGDTPAGILKGCVDPYMSTLTKVLNTSLEIACFPNQLKLAEVNPVLRKEDELSNKNHRPVSAPSHASKISERIVFSQMNLFLEYEFSQLFRGFSKNRSTPNVLLSIIEKTRSW